MSRFRDSSELTRLNRRAGSGQAIVMSRRLRIALVAAERARRVTEGRFDPRVLDDLDRLGYRGAPLDVKPVPAGRAEPSGPAVRHVGRTALVVDDRLDLGGIGKGLTLRWAAARLERNGCATFLLEAGATSCRADGRGCRRVGGRDRRPGRRRRSPRGHRLPLRERRGGDVVDADQPVADRRPGRPSPARSRDGRARWQWAPLGDGSGARPRLGRGLVESAVPRRFRRHRRRGTHPRHRGLVGRCVSGAGDDAGSPIEDGLVAGEG